MLSDIKTIIEIVTKLFSVKDSERERIANLLQQISSELTDLASTWLDVSVAISSGSVDSDGEVEALLLRQMSKYRALIRFYEYKKAMGGYVDQSSLLTSETGVEAFDLIADALSTKGELILLANTARHGNSPVIEEASNDFDEEGRRQRLNIDPSDPLLVETDKIIARYYQRNHKKLIQAQADNDCRRAAARAKALDDMKIRVGTLYALAGELRTLTALYKAGQAR